MSYSSEVLADSPLAYWRLGEASGTSASDASGNGRTGTYNNTPTLGAAGPLTSDADTAVTFASASSEDMRAAFWSELNTTVFTLECWVKTTGANQAIMGRQGTSSAPYVMFVDPSGFLQIVIKTSGTSGPSYSSATAINDGNWHHVAITRDGSANIEFYVDGDPVHTVTSSSAPGVATSHGFAVASRGGTPYLNGSVDEAAVYDTALSAARILAHYEAASAIIGTLNAESGLPAASFAGTYDPPTDFDGTLDATTPLPAASFAGTFVPPPYDGTLAAAAPLPSGAFAGAFDPPNYVGSFAGQTPQFEAAFVGHYTGEVATDTSNAENGRSRGGYALVTIDVPAVPAPAPTAVPELDLAIPFPMPTLVKGRPT